jgi:hypothetical protein
MERGILETAIVVVLGVLVWLFVEGCFGVPMARGRHTTLKHSPLTFHYSLRTLLIAVTLVAALLGLWVFLT